MNSVNSIKRSSGLVAIYHCEFMSESSQKPDLTKHLSLKIVVLWDPVQRSAVSEREPALPQGTEDSVSVPNTAPHRARWPAHFLHMRYTNSPHHSFIPWSEDSRQAVDLLLWATIINYINLLTSSQTGIKWQHHDFFFLFSVCFVNITELFYFISSWAKVHSFLCPCFFSVYKHRRETVLCYLGEFGIICRNSHRGCLPSLETFSFLMLSPPSSVFLEGSSSGGCCPHLCCSFKGHLVLLWQLNQELKERMDFPSDLQSIFELTC